MLVFDIDNGYKFVKRIPTWETPAGKEPENVKGIAASAITGRLYVTTFNRMAALDIATGRKIWDRSYEGGCDRMAISPDGKILYTPSLEGPHWNVVDADTGDVITKIVTKSGSHNTIYSLDGSRVYMAGLRSPFLSVADTTTHTVVQTVGPFSKPIRPFTVNGRGTLVFVNVNDLPGFEVGDLRTGKMLYRVEIDDYQPGPLKRHGCPSHGIALTPDEKELWLADGANNCLRVFDATVMPPKQVTHRQTSRLPRLDQLQHRRPSGLLVHRRDHRHPHQEDRRHSDGRKRPTGSERETPRAGLRRRESDRGRAISSASARCGNR